MQPKEMRYTQMHVSLHRSEIACRNVPSATTLQKKLQSSLNVKQGNKLQERIKTKIIQRHKSNVICVIHTLELFCMTYGDSTSSNSSEVNNTCNEVTVRWHVTNKHCINFSFVFAAGQINDKDF